MILKFSGHSDDNIHIEGNQRGIDVAHPLNGEPFDYAILNVGGTMKVYAFYNGTWFFAVGLIDEDIPLPTWPIKHYMEGYSAVMEIDVPDDVRVFQEV